MKLHVIALSLIAGSLAFAGTSAGAAWADDNVQGAAASATTSAPNAATPVYSTGETPVGTLLDDPASRAVLEAHVPSRLFTNPQVVMVRGMTLRQLQMLAPVILSNDVLDAIDVDLAGLGRS
jgi:hypothetical protein